ncbi:efflux RND transporter periplasmic adaptor subunit [Prosthecomicrobium sp. N25]|uniref:efflux RND transporter periplasmic adaptor subunit n=1 Tax=Prosthecomicrobium sp. N25 TaxID=3129254 RepID=UPI003077DFD1
MRVVRWLLIVLLLAGAAAGAWIWHDRPIAVTTVAVRKGTAAEVVYATGVVEPQRWAKVQPVVRGRIVDLCRHCEGDTVKAGEVIGRLDDGVARASLKELQAREQFARGELDRSVELLARKVVSQQAYDRASSELSAIQAAIAAQTARLDDFILRAPMDGTILRRDGEIGEVADTGTVLFWIGLEKPLEVVAEVNEEDIPRVEAGMTALLRSDAFPGRGIEGTVARITPKGDPVAKTYRVRIGLPDDTPLRIGMTVDVNVVVRRVADAVVLPRIALDGDRVFLVGADGRAVLRPVKVGIRSASEVEILEGVGPGERVVAPVPAGLAAGRRVTADGGGGS